MAREKLPPCNKAILSIRIENEEGQATTIKHNLFLHSKCEGMLCILYRYWSAQKGES